MAIDAASVNVANIGPPQNLATAPCDIGAPGPNGQTSGNALVISGSVSSTALASGTNRSSSITVGGTAQVLAAANSARRGLVGQNISSGDLWINEIGGTAAADTAGSYRVPAGASFSVSTSRAISVVGATTGQAFTATEF